MSLATLPSKPEGVAGRDFISWSQLSTFRQCPLRYHFRYVKCLPEESVSASFLFGGAFHAAIELHHRQVLEDDRPPSLDELLSVFWAEWHGRAEVVERIKYNKGDDVDTMGQLADRMLIAFQKSQHSHIDGRVVGIEEELRGPVIPGFPDLLARIDLVIDRGDEIVVRDYKTARSRWSQSTADRSAGQLLLYGELAGRLATAKRLRLEFVVVTKAKTPAVERYAVDADPDRVERTRRIARRTCRAIQNGEIYPNPSPTNCSTCPYQAACAAWEG